MIRMFRIATVIDAIFLVPANACASMYGRRRMPATPPCSCGFMAVYWQ